MVLLVPEHKSLEKSYEDPAAVADRFSQLREAFTKRFGGPPELISRAPGRVNLIGEHIDYEGYGVLPMAIKQDTIVAIRKGGTKLAVSNLSEEYPVIEFETDPKQDVDLANRSWASYFMCAYKGVFEMLEARHESLPEPVGLELMVHGIVPTGSGLSSSAAIVCSCMLALVGIYGVSAGRAEVAEWAAKAEQYVGVASGGMDQAISMMGMMGVAMMVEFNPVRAADVVLPPGCTFVLANSLATSKKAEGAHKRYNYRVVECRLASAILALAVGVSKEKAVELKTLKDVEPYIAEKYGAGDILALSASAVDEHVHDGYYTNEEVETTLGISLTKLFEDSAVSLKVVEYAKEVGGFKLHDRAKHVYEEAARVHAFKDICSSESEPADKKLKKIGSLMDASHASCAKLYECSCPELDELVAASKAAGSVGARLTGAGWGGCTVSLVRDEDVQKFMTEIRSSYYDARIKAGIVKEEDLGETMFASKPSSGAAILRL